MRPRVDINHHFYYVNPSSSGLFAFLRISKNASTSIITHPPLGFDPARLVHINDYPHEVYCCIRNPIDRFISSIPETLLRYTVRHKASRLWSAAVYVSEDVSARLNALAEVTDPYLFISEYLDLVRGGVFDAHHQPQIDFFTNRERKIFRPIHFFALENIDDAVASICSRHSLRYQRINSVNVRIGRQNNQHGVRGKVLKRSPLRVLKKQVSDIAKDALARRGYYSIRHREPVINKWALKGDAAGQIARELKILAQKDHAIRSEIQQLYIDDLNLYDNLLAKEESVVDSASLFKNPRQSTGLPT